MKSFQNEPVIAIQFLNDSHLGSEKSQGRKVETPFEPSTVQHEISRRYILYT